MARMDRSHSTMVLALFFICMVEEDIIVLESGRRKRIEAYVWWHKNDWVSLPKCEWIYHRTWTRIISYSHPFNTVERYWDWFSGVFGSRIFYLSEVEWMPNADSFPSPWHVSTYAQIQIEGKQRFSPGRRAPIRSKMIEDRDALYHWKDIHLGREYQIGLRLLEGLCWDAKGSFDVCLPTWDR